MDSGSSKRLIPVTSSYEVSYVSSLLWAIQPSSSTAYKILKIIYLPRITIWTELAGTQLPLTCQDINDTLPFLLPYILKCSYVRWENRKKELIQLHSLLGDAGTALRNREIDLTHFYGNIIPASWNCHPSWRWRGGEGSEIENTRAITYSVVHPITVMLAKKSEESCQLQGRSGSSRCWSPDIGSYWEFSRGDKRTKGFPKRERCMNKEIIWLGNGRKHGNAGRKRP